MGWQTFKVKDVCSVEKEKLGKDKLPYVGMEDIESGTGRFLGDSLPKSVASSTFKFSDKHVLYGRLRPYLNKVLVPNFKGHCSSEIFPLKPVHNLDRSFLAYWLRSERVVSAINRTCTGARMPRANVKEVLEFDIDIPSIDEQRRIVAILDEAFADIDKARALTERNLENSRELFESYLQHVYSGYYLGYPIVSWSEVLEIRSGRNQRAVEDDDGKYPIIGSAGKVMGYATDYICEEGTTIIGRKGTINNPKYISEKFWNVDTAFGLSAKPRLDRKFLFYFCKSFDFTERDKGSGRPSLVKNDLLTVKMPLPPMKKQIETVKNLQNLETQNNALFNNYTAKLVKLDKLKKSLLQKAFTGELTRAAS